MALLKSIFVLALFSSSLVLAEPVQATTSADVKQKSKEALETAADYSKEQKEQVQKNMEKSLNSLKEEIAELKVKAANKVGEAKETSDEQIEALQARQKELSKKLTEFKNSSGKAWTEMKNGMSAAIKKLSESYDKAKKEYQ